MPRLALTSLLGVALVGCRVPPPPPPTSTIDSVPRSEPITAEPEPITAEPEPIDSPPTPIVFGYVTPGGEGWNDLPQVIDKGGPAWLAAVGPGVTSELSEAMARAGLDLNDDDVAGRSSEAIEPGVIVRAGFGPPQPTIWLFDDEGACEARITTPYVGVYDEGGPVAEFSWRLEGCDPSRAWGPIGLFTVAPPERLRWIESTVSFLDPVDLASFSGRAAPLLREFASGLESPPDEYWLRELSIGETGIAQVQLAGLWRHHPARGEEYDDCEESATFVEHTGQWRESGFEPYSMDLELPPWDDAPELIGAFVVDGEPRWLVFSASMQALVITPGDKPQTIITGVYHDEVVAGTGWSPAASCEP